MNNKTKQLTLSGTILALAIILVIVQIPVVSSLGLCIDFSLVALIIGRRYVGLGSTFIILLIYPWFALSSGGTPIGSLFLVLQGIVLILVDLGFNRKGFNWFGSIMTVLIVTLWSAILNIFLIGPMFGFWGEWADGTYTYLSDWTLWLVVALIFNPFKLGIIYAICTVVWIGLENSINQEPNEEWVKEQEDKKASKEKEMNKKTE